jgi:rare lipoprotein A
MKRLFALFLSFSILASSLPLVQAEEASRKDLLLQRRELMKIIRSEDKSSSKLGQLREELTELKAAIRELSKKRRAELLQERKNRIDLRRLKRQASAQKRKLNIVKLPEVETIISSTVTAQETTSSTEFGKASYYADMFNGRTTASGEIFSNAMMTAAHKTLPFGTRVRVTSISNGNTIEVRINDRGPFVAGRIIDLTSTGFAALDNISRGVMDVRVDVLE